MIDLDQGVLTKTINDHKCAPITSLDSFFIQDKHLTYWLASSRDRRVSVWSCKWSENLVQLLDWLTLPAPIFSETNSSKHWLKYPPSIALFECNNPKTNAPIETLLYVGYGLNKEILVYNFVKKQIIRSMSLSEWPECLCVSPKSNFIAFGTKTRLLQIKDYKTGSFQDYAQHSDKVSSVCFSNDGKRLFSTAYNEIFIWDVKV